MTTRLEPTLAVAFVGCALLLAGCGSPVPEAKRDYVGHWRAASYALRIGADGSVSYRNNQGAANVTVDAPIQEFLGDDFVVGVAFVTTTFVVNAPPRYEDGQWRMVVDGVDLRRCIDIDCVERPGAGPEIEVLAHGLFGPEASDGSREVVRSTQRVPGRVGSAFGIRYRLDGGSIRAPTLTYRWDFPEPLDFGSGPEDYWIAEEPNPLREEHWLSMDFEDETEIVPGEWTLSILHGTRLLARQSFSVQLN